MSSFEKEDFTDPIFDFVEDSHNKKLNVVVLVKSEDAVDVYNSSQISSLREFSDVSMITDDVSVDDFEKYEENFNALKKANAFVVLDKNHSMFSALMTLAPYRKHKPLFVLDRAIENTSMYDLLGKDSKFSKSFDNAVTCLKGFDEGRRSAYYDLWRIKVKTAVNDKNSNEGSNNSEIQDKTKSFEEHASSSSKDTPDNDTKKTRSKIDVDVHQVFNTIGEIAEAFASVTDSGSKISTAEKNGKVEQNVSSKVDQTVKNAKRVVKVAKFLMK